MIASTTENPMNRDGAAKNMMIAFDSGVCLVFFVTASPYTVCKFQ